MRPTAPTVQQAPIVNQVLAIAPRVQLARTAPVVLAHRLIVSQVPTVRRGMPRVSLVSQGAIQTPQGYPRVSCALLVVSVVMVASPLYSVWGVHTVTKETVSAGTVQQVGILA